jgi:thymidylate synthase (FAD)
MRQVEPRVYIIGSSHVEVGLWQYLEDIGFADWDTNTGYQGDVLSEVAGRLCYRSWGAYNPDNAAETNQNLSRVREGNAEYLANTLRQGHGSIFEHAVINVIFRDVSRVFTHELVRHRAGCAYSQESMRFVRPGSLGIWVPTSIQGDTEKANLFIHYAALEENFWKRFCETLGIVTDADFATKKQLTSLSRRLAPAGTATTILASMNIRAWRHVINMRADNKSAEEEMIYVMNKLAPLLKKNCPAGFQDLEFQGGRWVLTINPKV